MQYSYFENLAIAFDQLFNALFNGACDETLSARAHRLSIERDRHWPMRFINVIFFWEKDHCKTAYESEKLRRQLPEAYQ